ncbi:MAG TPA: hypothetical protein VFO71_09845, partial [Gemmatimonadales bacterium]|nr:hypothetical protein [Gemmatimonadales bacterium]
MATRTKKTGRTGKTGKPAPSKREGADKTGKKEIPGKKAEMAAPSSVKAAKARPARKTGRAKA